MRTMTIRWSWLLALALLVAGAPADRAEARRKKKESFSARIDGKLLKAAGKHYNDAFDSVLVLVQGDTPLRLHRTVRSLAVSCGLDVTTAVLPVTPVFPTICVMGYATFSFERGLGVPKQWSGSNADGAVEVTFDSFDGTTLRGTFRGTLTPLPTNAGEPPVSVEGGKFTAIVGN